MFRFKLWISVALAPLAFLGFAATASAAEPLMSRGVFVQLVTQELYPADETRDCFKDIAPSQPVSYTKLFNDVSISDNRAHALCLGINYGLIDGNRNGDFRPNDSINFAEASKILALGYGVALPDSQKIRPLGWHWRYTEALKRKQVLDWRVKNYDQALTESEAKTMIQKMTAWKPRILTVKTAAPAVSAETTPVASAQIAVTHRLPTTITQNSSATKAFSSTIGNYHMRLAGLMKSVTR